MVATPRPRVDQEAWVQHASLADGDVYVRGRVVAQRSDPTHGLTSDVHLAEGVQCAGASFGMLTVPSVATWPVNEPGSHELHDLTELHFVHEAALLSHVRERYEHGHIYTYVGPTLVSLNPFRDLPDEYGEERMADFKRTAAQRSARRPHLYAIAELAHRSVQQEHCSASVIVSGESGAGKTEASKHLLRYLSWRAGAASGTMGVATRILHSTPVFEAFGNARTPNNDNSSRFGKHMEVMLTQEGGIAGARVRTFLLEKRRAAAPPPPREANFHVFYLMAARREGSLLPAGRGAESFRCLTNDVDAAAAFGAEGAAQAQARARGAARFAEVAAALRQLFVPDEAQAAVWRLLCAVLLLGEVTFEADAEGNARPTRPEALAEAEAAFGCPGLGALLTAQPMLSPRGSSTYTIALDVKKAAAARDSVVAELYRALFDALLARVNAVLSATREAGSPGGGGMRGGGGMGGGGGDGGDGGGGMGSGGGGGGGGEISHLESHEQ